LRARADYELGWSILSRGEVELFVKRCAEIVAEEAASGADEPDPPADH